MSKRSNGALHKWDKYINYHEVWVNDEKGMLRTWAEVQVSIRHNLPKRHCLIVSKISHLLLRLSEDENTLLVSYPISRIPKQELEYLFVDATLDPADVIQAVLDREAVRRVMLS